MQLLGLQRSAGNVAVAALVQRATASALTATPSGLEGARKHSASSDTISIAGAEGSPSLQVLGALHRQAGKNVVEMDAHAWKVERYARYLEGDLLFVSGQRAALRAAKGEGVELEKAAAAATDVKKRAAIGKQRLEVKKRMTVISGTLAAEGPMGDDASAATAEKAVSGAATRLESGLEAQSRVSAEKPVVGFAYDETKTLLGQAEAADPQKLKHAAVYALGDKELEQRRRVEQSQAMGAVADVPRGATKAPGGEGRLAKWRRGRAERSEQAAWDKRGKELEGDAAHRALAGRFPAIVGDAVKAATPLVQQSILSEQVVAVKRKQLKAMKATVKKTLGRGTTIGRHVANKVVTGVAAGIVSAATFGAVDLEARKTQGGYKSERRYVTPWTRCKEDLAALRGLAESRPYGTWTTAYTVLKGFNELVVKQIRNLFGGMATTLGLLGLIPGAQPLLGVAAICAVVSIAAAALKLVVDTTLTGWNAVATARNDNAYNKRLMRGELMSTGMDALGSAMRVGGAFVGPLASNASFAAAGSQARVGNPLEMAHKVGGIGGTGDLAGVHGMEGGVENPVGHGSQVGPVPIRVDSPFAYAEQQAIKVTGVATGAGSTITGKVADAVAGTEGLGAGAKAKLQHGDRNQWRNESSQVTASSREQRSVPQAPGSIGGASELEKEAAVKNAARQAQGRWAKDQGLALVGRVDALRARVSDVAEGIAGKAGAAAKDGPEAAQDASGAAGAAGAADGALGAVLLVLRDGAEAASEE